MHMQDDKRQHPTEISLRNHFREIGVEVEPKHLADILRNAIVLQDHATTLQAFDPLSEPWLNLKHGD